MPPPQKFSALPRASSQTPSQVTNFSSETRGGHFPATNRRPHSRFKWAFKQINSFPIPTRKLPIDLDSRAIKFQIDEHRLPPTGPTFGNPVKFFAKFLDDIHPTNKSHNQITQPNQ
jgi:hypothetical protein